MWIIVPSDKDIGRNKISQILIKKASIYISERVNINITMTV